MTEIFVLMDQTMSHPMMMTNYPQLFVFVLYCLLMKLYGFSNFVEQHLVPYEYASISLVVIEVSMWLL